MMQPYRIAVRSSSSPSCLDPPIRACESPPPRPAWWREMVIAGAIVLAGTTTAWAATSLGHAGRVEIAPTALAHARGRPRPKRAPPSRSVVRRDSPSPVSTRPFVVGLHDPAQLVARAKKLEALGIDLTVVDVPLSDAVARSTDFASGFWPASWVPVYGASHALTGLALASVPAGSALRVAGLSDGDQVLAIDGYDFADDTLHRVDANAIRARGWIVAEIARGEHHLVLSIHWRT